MLRIFHFLVLLLASSIAVAASPTDQSATESDSNHPSIQEILKDVDEAKIHEALHVLSDKFRHGVFPTDVNAVEALHKEDSSLGARLMKLAKRANGGPGSNSTASVSPPPATSESTPPTSQVRPPSFSEVLPSESTPKTTPTEPTPTESTTPTQTTPTQATSTESTPTVTPPNTSTEAQPTTEHSTPATTPSTPSPSTTPDETTSTTSSSSPTSSTPTQAPSTFSTSSKDPETTPATTHATTHASNEPYTSTYQSTTTLSNGQLSTVTEVTVVHPTPTGSKATKTPGLQNGGAAPPTGMTKEALAIVGGAVMVAMAL